MMQKYQNFIQLLQDRAINLPQEIPFTFLSDSLEQSSSITYQEIEQQARAIAAQLQMMGLSGERALVVYPYHQALEFIGSFFGCLYAGVVAVTDNPPRNSQGIEKLSKRVIESEAKVVVTTLALQEHLQQQSAKNPEILQSPLGKIPWVATDTISSKEASNWREISLDLDSLAFLQYTSGSTGVPKGVMVTHGNIVANSEAIYQAFQHNCDTKALIWLPLFHDMGLLGGVFQPVFGAFSMTLMSPVSVIQNPWRWVEAISKYKINTSGSANFAYDLLSQQAATKSLEDLDLSSWDVAFSGAEPVRAETIETFSQIFAPVGFSRKAFYPCYGMAETTLFVSGGDKNGEPIIVNIDKTALAKNLAVKVDPKHPEAKQLVGCGHSWLKDQILIVNLESLTECKEQEVGEIWVKGSGVGLGYWNSPEQTSKTFRAYVKDTQAGPFLRTGDLGFVAQGELFIAGRLKDMMILWGRNHYPQHIEFTVEKSYPGFRFNCGAAFAVEVDSRERLVIVQEVERAYLSKLNAKEAIAAIRTAVAKEHLAEVYGVVLIKTGTIPKTSSGKVQRSRCKNQFLEGSLESIATWQLAADEQTTIVEMLNN